MNVEPRGRAAALRAWRSSCRSVPSCSGVGFAELVLLGAVGGERLADHPIGDARAGSPGGRACRRAAGRPWCGARGCRPARRAACGRPARGRAALRRRCRPRRAPPAPPRRPRPCVAARRRWRGAPSPRRVCRDAHPLPGERGVVDQPDLVEPLQPAFAASSGTSPLAQRLRELLTGAGAFGEQAQADLPRDGHRVGLGLPRRARAGRDAAALLEPGAVHGAATRGPAAVRSAARRPRTRLRRSRWHRGGRCRRSRAAVAEPRCRGHPAAAPHQGRARARLVAGSGRRRERSGAATDLVSAGVRPRLGPPSIAVVVAGARPRLPARAGPGEPACRAAVARPAGGGAIGEVRRAAALRRPGAGTPPRAHARRSTTAGRSTSGASPRSDATGARAGSGEIREAHDPVGDLPAGTATGRRDLGGLRMAGPPSLVVTVRSRPARAAARCRRRAPRRCRASP